MIGEVLFQCGKLRAPICVVQERGILREGLRDVRMIRHEVTKALVALILRDVIEPRIVVRESRDLGTSNLYRVLSACGHCDRKGERYRGCADPRSGDQL